MPEALAGVDREIGCLTIAPTDARPLVVMAGMGLLPLSFPMQKHRGPRLFITGIATAGKSHLADVIASQSGGIAVHLDHYRADLCNDPRYAKWARFYSDQDERQYYATTDDAGLWANAVALSEAIWPALLAVIASHSPVAAPVIFEGVNILPHLAQRDLPFPGIVLLGDSYETTLARNRASPRWGASNELHELEARQFFVVERPHFHAEAVQYGYHSFDSSDAALTQALSLIEGQRIEGQRGLMPGLDQPKDTDASA
jgi:hypothetical protein